MNHQKVLSIILILIISFSILILFFSFPNTPSESIIHKREKLETRDFIFFDLESNLTSLTINFDITAVKGSIIAILVYWYHLPESFVFDYLNHSSALYYQEFLLYNNNTFEVEIAYDTVPTHQPRLFIINPRSFDRYNMEIKMVIDFEKEQKYSFLGFSVLTFFILLISSISLAFVSFSWNTITYWLKYKDMDEGKNYIESNNQTIQLQNIMIQSFPKRLTDSINKNKKESDDDKVEIESNNQTVTLEETPEQNLQQRLNDSSNMKEKLFLDFVKEIEEEMQSNQIKIIKLVGIILVFFFAVFYLGKTVLNNFFYLIDYLQLLFLGVNGSREEVSSSLVVLPFELRLAVPLLNAIMYFLGSIGIILGLYIIIFCIINYDLPSKSAKYIFSIFNKTSNEGCRLEKQIKGYISFNEKDSSLELKKFNVNWNLERTLDGFINLVDYSQLIILIGSIISFLLFNIYFIFTLFFFLSTTNSGINLEVLTYILGTGPFKRYVFLFFLAPILPWLIYYYGFDAYRFYHIRNFIINSFSKSLFQKKIDLALNEDQGKGIDYTYETVKILKMENTSKRLKTLPIYPIWGRMVMLTKYGSIIAILIQLYTVLTL